MISKHQRLKTITNSNTQQLVNMSVRIQEHLINPAGVSTRKKRRSLSSSRNRPNDSELPPISPSRKKQNSWMLPESSGDQALMGSGGVKLPNISVSKFSLSSANQSTTAIGDTSHFSKLAGGSADDPLMVGSSRFSKFGSNQTPDSLNASLLLGSGAKRASALGGSKRGPKKSIEQSNLNDDILGELEEEEMDELGSMKPGTRKQGVSSMMGSGMSDDQVTPNELTSPDEFSGRVQSQGTHNRVTSQPVSGVPTKPKKANVYKSKVMHPKVMEMWINETLSDCEHLDIPGVILKPENKNPMARYGIDRMTLSNNGIPSDLIDRVYRALFVYSVGFYELIKKSLSYTGKRYAIITNLWKVFAILLEYCSKSDYRLLISEISRQHKEQIEKMEIEFSEKLNVAYEKEAKLCENIDQMKKYLEQIQNQRNEERALRIKLENQFMENSRSHEDEVKLRLKFESKLNDMHSLHRDLEARYARAVEEIDEIQAARKLIQTERDQMKIDFSKLKTERNNLQSALLAEQEKTKHQSEEIEMLNVRLQKSNQKLNRIERSAIEFRTKLERNQQKEDEKMLKIDALDTTIDALEKDRENLNNLLKDAKSGKESLITKRQLAEIKLQEAIKKIEISRNQIISLEEIKAQYEIELKKLKTELKSSKEEAVENDRKFTYKAHELEKLIEQFKTLDKEHNETIEKLKKMNRARNYAEEKLSEEQEITKESRAMIQERDQLIERHAVEIDRLNKKIQDLDRTIENLEIKRVAFEKQTEIQKKELTEKISSLQDIIKAEKTTRESWIDRYKKEQDDHSETHKQVIKLMNKLKDEEMAKRNALVKGEALQHQIKKLEAINEAQLNRVHEKEVSLESLQRDLKTQIRMTQLTNESWQERFDRVTKKLEQRISELQLQDVQKETQYQDLYSAAVELENHKNALVAEVERLLVQMEHKDLQITEMNKALEVERENLERTQKQLDQETERANSLTVKLEVAEEQVTSMKDAMDALQKKVDELEEVARVKLELEEELVELKHQLRNTEEELEQEIAKHNIETFDEEIQVGYTPETAQAETQKPGPDSVVPTPAQSRQNTVVSSQRERIENREKLDQLDRESRLSNNSRKSVYRHPISYSMAEEVKRQVAQERKSRGKDSGDERSLGELSISAQSMEEEIKRPDITKLSMEKRKQLQEKGLIKPDSRGSNKPSSSSDQRKFLKVDTVPEVPQSPSPNNLMPVTGNFTPEGITGGPKLEKTEGVDSMSQFDGLEGGRSIDDEEQKSPRGVGTSDQRNQDSRLGEHPGMKVSIASKRTSSEGQAALTRTSFQGSQRKTPATRGERGSSGSPPKEGGRPGLGKSNIKTMIRTAAMAPK